MKTRASKSPYHDIEVYDAVNAPSVAKRFYDITYLREALAVVGAPRTLNATELFGGHDYYSDKLHLALPAFNIKKYHIIERNANRTQSNPMSARVLCSEGDARTCDYAPDTNLVLSWYFSMNAIQTFDGLIAFFTNAARQIPESGELYMYNNIYPFTAYTPAGDFYDGSDCFKIITSDNVVYPRLVGLAGTTQGHFYATYSLRTKLHILNNSFGLHYEDLTFWHEACDEPRELAKVDLAAPILVRPWTTGEIHYAIKTACDSVGVKFALTFLADYNKSPYATNPVERTPARANIVTNVGTDITETLAKRNLPPHDDIQHPTDMVVVFSK